MIEARKSIKMDTTGFKDNYWSLYRNYFEARAQAGQSVQTVFYALRGLKNLFDQSFLIDAAGTSNVITFDGK
jgi:hypothetical protein